MERYAATARWASRCSARSRIPRKPWPCSAWAVGRVETAPVVGDLGYQSRLRTGHPDGDALGAGMAARVGQRLADDAQHLGAAAPEGAAGQVSGGLKGPATARCHLAADLDEFAQGVGERAFAVLFEPWVVDGGAELAADVLQDRVDLVVAACGVQAGHGQGVRQALERAVAKVLRDAAAGVAPGL